MPVSQGPLIGVTARRSDPAWVEDHVRAYLRAVQAAGGEALVIAPDSFCGPPYVLDRRVGALVLTGGGDVHPRRYGQTPAGTDMDSVDEARDEMEVALVRRALEADLAVLGICRGIQVLNVAMGGTLRQDVDGHRAIAGKSAQHDVRIAPASLLVRALGCSGILQTNSRHHQAIDAPSLAPALRACAWSLPDDAVIEAVEAPEYRWVLGVQWHPERAAEVPPVHQRLFAAFVAAARQDS